MAIERTFSIIKPNAVAKNAIGDIVGRFEQKGLKVIASKMVKLTTEQAQGFYAEHDGKPFFENLIRFMTSGPSVVQVLEGEGAIELNRTIMGATNPEDQAPGTIRADYADDITKNAVHGSDSPESAAREIAYFFSDNEIC